jgi:hypothetical protein
MAAPNAPVYCGRDGTHTAQDKAVSRGRTMPNCGATSPVKQRLTPRPARTFLLLGAPYPLVAPQFTETIERLIREWAVVERVFRV